MFWYTAQKDYLTAVESLKRVAKFNGVDFENTFQEARDFLRGKRSKGVQCDFQPLLRLGKICSFYKKKKKEKLILLVLEDIQLLGSKYPDFDMVDLQTTTHKKKTLSERIIEVLIGHHYYPTLSTFYPTDYLHSLILTIYLLLICGLWFAFNLTRHKTHFFY